MRNQVGLIGRQHAAEVSQVMKLPGVGKWRHSRRVDTKCERRLVAVHAEKDDFISKDSLVDLPKMEVALEHLYSLDPGEYAAATCMYLGVLNTLRPPALGGKPEVGREWFERGISLSEGKDLSIKVEYARGYARLLYDRELHDRLLNEVMQADVKQPNLTLFNVLAQEQAAALLASADDYF